MSDFLRNLAARSLGRLDVVHPHRPSRYEPSQIANGEPDDLIVDEIAQPVADPNPPLQPERSTPSLDSRAQPSVPAHKPATPISQPEAPTAVPPQGLVGPEAPDVLDPSLDQKQVRSSRRSSIEADTTSGPRADELTHGLITLETPGERPHPGQMVESSLFDDSETAPERASLPGRRQQPAPTLAASSEDGGGSPTSEPLVPSITTRHETMDHRRDVATPIEDDPRIADVEPPWDRRDDGAPPSPLAQGTHTSEFETRPQTYHPADQERGDDAPIRVTIGRIDVRAIKPEPPRTHQRPARPRPQLSLADYLKQRSGGG